MSRRISPEEGSSLSIDFSKLRRFFKGESQNGEGIISVVVQDATTKEVLMVAYANEAALHCSLKNRVATFWSTSRNELWIKGLTSGSTLELVEARVNCEQNSLLYLVKPVNNFGACHTRERKQCRKTCFYRTIKKADEKFVLEKANNAERRKTMEKLILGIPNGSLEKPTLQLLEKVGIKTGENGRNFLLKIENSDVFGFAILMRPQDIPEALIDGMIDAAIYGKDWHEEKGLGEKLSVVAELNYSKKTNQPARVVVFGKTPEITDSKKILVTSEYPNLAKRIFKKARIRLSYGGTEQKVAYGKYDFGVCVAETGDSLRENDLVIAKEIMVSPVLLVARKMTTEIGYFGELLQAGIKAEKHRLLKFNVEKEKIPGVLETLPALESPTISELANKNFAVETVAPKEEISNLIITLKKLGATGILVQNLDIVD